ncbi:hypothetical protein TNCV_1772931 [Trichonephila clavipes]|nr:hypothetical protein TNCV_1772931 [Trichonephila clavipes]
MTGTGYEEIQDYMSLLYCMYSGTHVKMWQKMFKVSTIARDACVSLSDHGLVDSLKYTWYLLDIHISTEEFCNQIHFGIHKCCVRCTSQCTRKKEIRRAYCPENRPTSPNPSLTKHLIQIFTNTSDIMGRCFIMLKLQMASDTLWYRNK